MYLSISGHHKGYIQEEIRMGLSHQLFFTLGI